MRSRIARATFWVVWSRGVVQGISLISTLVVARLLSPEAFGLMALAAVWTGALSLIAELGLGAALVQFRDLRDAELNACFWLITGLSILGYVVLYASAPAIATLFANDSLSGFLRVVALAVPLVAVRIVPESLLRKGLRLDKISQAEIAALLATIPVVIGLAAGGAGAWALAAGMLVRPLVLTVAIYSFTRWRPGLTFKGGKVRPLLAFGAGRLGSVVCWTAYQQADVLILGKVCGGFVLGLYSMALEISQLPVEKISAVVNQLAFPVMAELQADRPAMRAVVLRGLQSIACVTFPLCVGVMLLADDLVLVALTGKWSGAVPAVRLLSLYALVRSLAVLLPTALLASYRARFLFSYNLVLLLAMPPAFWIGAVQWQAIGVAAAWLVVYPPVMVWMVREALREVGLSWTVLARHLWPPVTATLAMVAVMVPALWATTSWTGPLVPVRLVLTGLAGASTYAGVLFRFHRSATLDIQEVLGWVLPGRPNWRIRKGSLTRPMRTPTDNIRLYNQDALWERPYLDDPYYRAKVRLVRGMIPDDVRSILDVACGNGAMTNLLKDYWTVGGDRSPTALRYVNGRAVQLSADSLPFSDRAFDCVMCHQALEHLPEAVLQPAIGELVRVARRYLLISVPYRERLAQQQARCGDCRHTYHVWGHVRRFGRVREVRELFPDFVLRIHAFCGRENSYMTPQGLWIRQRLGGRWAVEPTAVCPICGSRSQVEDGFPRRAIAAVVDRIEARLPREPAFWWLVCLLERTGASGDSIGARQPLAP